MLQFITFELRGDSKFGQCSSIHFTKAYLNELFKKLSMLFLEDIIC